MSSVEDTIRILEIERTCVLRQDTPECCREEFGCGACDLVQSQDDVLKAYDNAIAFLKWVKVGARMSGDTVSANAYWIDEKPCNSPFAKQYRCSKCGVKAYRGNFCPDCGRPMKEVE